MPRNLIISFIILLIIIPLASLAYKYLIPAKPNTPLSSQSSNQLTNQKTPSALPQPTQPSTYNPTSDIKYVLDSVSKEGKTAKEAQDFAKSLSNAAVSTDNLDIAKCSPNPAIVRIEFNKQLNIKNSDTTAHSINVNSRNYKIEAGKTVGVSTAEIGQDSRIYPYTCDGSSQMMGIIWISK